MNILFDISHSSLEDCKNQIWQLTVLFWTIQRKGSIISNICNPVTIMKKDFKISYQESSICAEEVSSKKAVHDRLECCKDLRHSKVSLWTLTYVLSPLRNKTLENNFFLSPSYYYDSNQQILLLIHCHYEIKQFQDMLSPLKNLKMTVMQGNLSESISKHVSCMYACTVLRVAFIILLLCWLPLTEQKLRKWLLTCVETCDWQP